MNISASSLPIAPRLFTGSDSSLSQDLRDLRHHFQDRAVCLEELAEVLHGRGYPLLLIMLSLPFLAPVAIPLMSTPFGLVIAFIGLRLAMGHPASLPRFLRGRKLPAKFFPTLLGAASRVIGVLEKLLKPHRLSVFHDSMVFQRCCGGLIAIAGLLLLLPVPVPFSNFLPAWTVLLLSASTLARDGLFFLAGAGMFLISAAYFVLLPIGGFHLVTRLWASWG